MAGDLEPGSRLTSQDRRERILGMLNEFLDGGRGRLMTRELTKGRMEVRSQLTIVLLTLPFSVPAGTSSEPPVSWRIGVH